MSRLAIFATALLGSTALATAADLYTPPPVEEVIYTAPSAFDWTGFYAGVHGGFGGDKFKYPFDFDDGDVTGEASITSSGFFAGGQVGGNWQFAPQWVAGAVADIAWADIDGELEFDIDGLGSISAGSTVEWFGTVRGRIGFLPTERLMLYGTGGFAYGSVDSHFDILGFSDSTSDTQTGWAAGGGFEYAVTDNVTLFTEYLYVDLGDQTLFDDTFFGEPLTIDAETQFHTVKAGVNILFN